MSNLANEISLLVEPPLKENCAGYRECHLEPDWLLIYRLQGEYLILTRTGRHNDLFR